MQSGCIIQTFSSEYFCNYVSETGPEVCCAGDVTRGLDNGREPGEDVAREVEAGVQTTPQAVQCKPFVVNPLTRLNNNSTASW